jgi:hypothetical protein
MVVTGCAEDEPAEQFASVVLDAACDADGVLGYVPLTPRIMPRSVRDGVTEMTELVGLLTEATANQDDRCSDALDRLASSWCEARESWGRWLLAC